MVSYGIDLMHTNRRFMELSLSKVLIVLLIVRSHNIKNKVGLDLKIQNRVNIASNDTLALVKGIIIL